jgi:hypothetical protein
MLNGCTDAMHRCNAGVPCDAPMHVRTYELTHADTSKTESGSHVRNAHEENGYVYLVHWPEAGFTKVGFSCDGKRWRPFLRRGGVLLGVIAPADQHASVVEWHMHVDLSAHGVPQRFATSAEATPYLGGSGRGFTECYVDQTGREVIEKLMEIEQRKPNRWAS